MTFYNSVPVPVEIEFRANPDGTDTFHGYAAIFDSPSQPLPFIETIAPSAFDRALGRNARRQFVVNHDDRLLISSTDTGRLRLATDTKGLIVESPLGRTSHAADVRALAADGEIAGMSFSFRAFPKGETWSPDATSRRLTSVDLGHVTVLTGLEPAYHATTGLVAIRSLSLATSYSIDEIEEVLDAIRDGAELNDDMRAILRAIADSGDQARAVAEVEMPPEPSGDSGTEAVVETAPATRPNYDQARARLLAKGIAL